MRAVGEQKVPELQELRQRWGTSAHGQDRGEGVDAGLHMMRHEMAVQLRIHDSQHAVDERQALVYAIHGAAHIAGTLVRNEPFEAGKGLDLAAGRVQKRPAQHVHALHVASLLGVVGRRGIGARAAAARQRVARENRGVGAAAKLGERGRRLPAVDARLVRVIESPGHGVEHARDAVLRHPPPEERVALKGAEGVVLDLGVCGRRPLTHEVEVDVRFEGLRIEQDEPDVNAQLGLEERGSGPRQSKPLNVRRGLERRGGVMDGEPSLAMLGCACDGGVGTHTMPSLFAGIPLVRTL